MVDVFLVKQFVMSIFSEDVAWDPNGREEAIPLSSVFIFMFLKFWNLAEDMSLGMKRHLS